MVQLFTKYLLLEQLPEAPDRADLIVNAALRLIDMIVNGAVIDKRNDPPGSPAEFVAYIVGDTPTGDWTTFSPGGVAYWDGVAWNEHLPKQGTLVHDEARDEPWFKPDGAAFFGLLRDVQVMDWATLSATRTEYCATFPVKGTVESLSLVTPTATTSSGGAHWGFQLVNVTQTLNLFATAPNTNAAMGDFAADTLITLIPDQNKDVAAGDVLELVATLTGAPGNPTRFRVQVDSHLRPGA